MTDNTINPFVKQQKIDQLTTEYNQLKRTEKLEMKIAVAASAFFAVCTIGFIGCLASLSVEAYGTALSFSALFAGGAFMLYLLRIPAEAISPKYNALKLSHLESRTDPALFQYHPKASKVILNKYEQPVGHLVTLKTKIEFYEMKNLGLESQPLLIEVGY